MTDHPNPNSKKVVAKVEQMSDNTITSSPALNSSVRPVSPASQKAMEKLTTIQAIVFELHMMGSYAYLAQDAIEHYDTCVSLGLSDRADVVLKIAEISCRLSERYEQRADLLTLLLIIPQSRWCDTCGGAVGGSCKCEADH